MPVILKSDTAKLEAKGTEKEREGELVGNGAAKETENRGKEREKSCDSCSSPEAGILCDRR